MRYVYDEGQPVIFTNADGGETAEWHPAVGTIGTVVNSDDSITNETVKIMWPKGAVSRISEIDHPKGIWTYKSKIAPYCPQMVQSEDLDKMFEEY